MFWKTLLCSGLLLVLGLAGCVPSADGPQTAATTEVATAATATGMAATSVVTSTVGALESIVVPTLPATIPGYAEVDPATGLHMTGTPTVIDLDGYRLNVRGKVTNSLSLSYDELRGLPKVTATPGLVCPGAFADVATWTGVPLLTILNMAEVQPDAERITFVGADGYAASMDMYQALEPENFLAYELLGEPLPVLQGFPLRVVAPRMTGFVWVKWLQEIVVE